MAFETIIVERRGDVSLVTLDRPKALNAINQQLIDELTRAVQKFDSDGTLGCLVLTGSETAFAAGADIREIHALTFVDALERDLISSWDVIARARKPVIAAVAGYALGGGCELAMMCDFILAADNARFGQPEISLGVMPGAGGSQRLTRAVGKAKAMEMCLTGRTIDADEAERAGLVSRVVPAGDLIDEAMKTADKIAAMSRPAVMLAKECVNRALETSLQEGILFERRLFQAMFAFDDQKEGMQAFLDKREAQFKHK